MVLLLIDHLKCGAMKKHKQSNTIIRRCMYVKKSECHELPRQTYQLQIHDQARLRKDLGIFGENKKPFRMEKQSLCTKWQENEKIVNNNLIKIVHTIGCGHCMSQWTVCHERNITKSQNHDVSVK